MARIISSTAFIAAGMAVALSGCSTTSNTGTTPTGPRLPTLTPTRYVDPNLANACIVAAANKYYLPTRVIKAVDTNKSVDGATLVVLKVDLRDAVCTVNTSGTVRSVVDTSPKSADQIEAEALAAKAASAKQKAPAAAPTGKTKG